MDSLTGIGVITIMVSLCGLDYSEYTEDGRDYSATCNTGPLLCV